MTQGKIGTCSSSTGASTLNQLKISSKLVKAKTNGFVCPICDDLNHDAMCRKPGDDLYRVMADVLLSCIDDVQV